MALPDPYIVKKGDTLTKIAAEYNTTVDALVKRNNIKNRDYIVVGQKIYISGTGTTPDKNTTYQPEIVTYGLRSNTERGMYVDWNFDKSNVDHYLVRWYHVIEVDGTKKTLKVSETKVTTKYAVYDASNESLGVQVAVKPVAKNNEWKGSQKLSGTYYFKNNPPLPPPNPPTVSQTGVIITTMTVSYDNLDMDELHADSINFAVYKDTSTSLYRQDTIKIDAHGRASTQFTNLSLGSTFRVRARSVRDKTQFSEWTNFTDGLGTSPATVAKFTKCEARSATSVFMEWSAANGAESYNIEYATDRSYFDGSDSVTKVTGITTTSYEKTGLETGKTYFFRVNATNEKGESGWSEISSVTLGKAPSSPTTWSSTTVAMTGEKVTLFWVHNSGDNSAQTKAELQITIGGTTTTHTIDTTNKEDTTYHYDITNTASYPEGTKILWKVRTAGIQENVFSEWSAQRTIDIYAPPGIDLSVTDVFNEPLLTLERLPLRVRAVTSPSTQKPTGYHVEVQVHNDSNAYEILEDTGEEKIITPGTRVYSGYFATADDLDVYLYSNHMTLSDGAKYRLTVTASMDSSLTATAFWDFNVSWTTKQYAPNAKLVIDNDKLCTYICPYCEDGDEVVVSGVTLAVYRRELDGTFTEIASDITNNGYTFVTDPHPALDYARYRIVAKENGTGAISYYDMPGHPIGEKSIVVQWDEAWEPFTGDDGIEYELLNPPMTASILKLPYNVDVTESNSPDVELVKYIGRRHPVSYYGTQRGSTATWNAVIEKDDTTRLNLLRRLSIWDGNVYVREPSGTGYWANVTVSFGQKHRDLTIPVTLNIKRVEGGA